MPFSWLQRRRCTPFRSTRGCRSSSSPPTPPSTPPPWPKDWRWTILISTLRPELPVPLPLDQAEEQLSVPLRVPLHIREEPLDRAPPVRGLIPQPAGQFLQGLRILRQVVEGAVV